MRRMTLFLLTATVTAGCGRADAQGNAPAKWADTISTEIEQAQLAGDATHLDAAAALAARVATAYPNDGLILHYQGYAIYRQGILLAGRGGDGTALFEQARPILERSIKARPLAETQMLLSSIYGQLIAKDPSRGMELGIASSTATGAAMAMAPTNPRVWLLRGQGAIFTPKEYGGGLSVAEEQLKRAIELFAKDSPKPGEPSWGKAEAHAWLGQVYEKKGDKTKAAEEYKTAMEISPKYGFAQMLSAALEKNKSE
jgi:tetratricopeptide (TPR) repeat protein